VGARLYSRSARKAYGFFDPDELGGGGADRAGSTCAGAERVASPCGGDTCDGVACEGVDRDDSPPVRDGVPLERPLSLAPRALFPPCHCGRVSEARGVLTPRPEDHDGFSRAIAASRPVVRTPNPSSMRRVPIIC
jgi:hypothetical protein